ncbi:MAG: hypothetical protein ACRET8_00680 [Burkholderiales bacterium]
MITLAQYFAAKTHTAEQEAAAKDLLTRVDALAIEALAAGRFSRPICPNTGSEISGSKGGSGDGGFRLQSATTGSAKSSHKQGKGVDVYDPGDELDTWLDEFENGEGGNEVLQRHGLYREHPDSTPGWCHLSTRAPGSGRRTFRP